MNGVESLTAVVVAADPLLRAEIAATAVRLGVRIVNDRKAFDDEEDLLDAIERFRSDVVLLEGHLLSAPLSGFVSRLKLTASEPVVFLFQREAVAEQILEAMQAGAREYLCPPLDEPLAEAFARLAAVRAEQLVERQNKLGKLYGFLSAKGGCGASTFAVHFAAAAARRTTHTVLLADLDFEAGIQRFLLKAKPKYSIRDAVDNMHRMDASYWNAVVHPVGDRLELVAAPEELADREPADARHIARLLRFVRSLYRSGVLDFGRWHSAAALDSLPEMESLYLIVNQDLHAYEAARGFVRAADERGSHRDRIHLLINGVTAKQKPDLAAIERLIGVKPSGVFPDEREILGETWSEGRLLSSETSLGRHLTALAIGALELGTRAEDRQAGASSRLSLLARGLPFGRLFRSRTDEVNRA